MQEFYKLLDGYQLRQQQSDFRNSYFTTWLIAAQGIKNFNFNKTLEEVFNPLQPVQKTNEQEKEEFLKQFNI